MFAAAFVFYGLLIVWLVHLARAGGLIQVPQMLNSLGWGALFYSLGLIVLGTTFLCFGAALVGRKP
jgi:hypothetical protein